jgi:hypothetical protein
MRSEEHSGQAVSQVAATAVAPPSLVVRAPREKALAAQIPSLNSANRAERKWFEIVDHGLLVRAELPSYIWTCCPTQPALDPTV